MRFSTEAKIGAMVILFLVSIVFVLSLISYWGFLKRQGTVYYIRFPDVKGLRQGSIVRYNGAESGTVDQFIFENKARLIKVRIRLNKTIQVPQDSRYYIAVKSIIPPEVYLDIAPGTSSDKLKPGEDAPELGETQPDLADLVKDLSSQVKILSTSLNNMLASANATVQNANAILGEIGPDVKGLLQDVRQMVQVLNGRVNMILADVQGISGDARNTLRNVSSQVQDVLQKVDKSSESIANITKNVEQFSSDEELKKTLKDTVQSLHYLTENLNKLSATLGSEDLQKSIKNTISNVEAVTGGASSAVKQLSELHTSADVRTWWRRDDTTGGSGGEGQVSNLATFGIARGKQGWYLKVGEEGLGRENDFVGYLGYQKRDRFALGAGVRRNAPSVELRVGPSRYFAEGGAWWKESKDLTFRYQVIFAYQLHSPFYVFGGVDRQEETRPLVGFGAHF